MREVLDALAEGVVACDGRGYIVYANAAARALLGAGPLEGQPIESFVTPRDRVIRGQPIWRWLDPSPGGRILRTAVLRADGVEIDVDWSAGRAGDLLVVSMRPRVEAEPAAGDAGYRLVFDHAPLGIFHFDARGVITAANDVFVDIIGSNRRVLVGLNMTTLPNQGIVRCVRAALAGERARWEGDYTSVTGGKTTPVRVEFAPILEAGLVQGGVGIVEDVTERSRAESALRRSESSFQSLIEGLPDGVAVCRDGHMIYVNPAFVAALGWSDPSQLRERLIDEMVDPADRHVLHGGGQARFRRRDGGVCLAEVAILPLHWEGLPARVVLVRDVTERQALEARLAQADRMASLGTLAAGVAHEINNPLAYLITNLEAAARSAGGLAGHIDAALDGAERVRVIVRDLKTFSRPNEGAAEDARRVPVDVEKVLDAAVNMTAGEVKRRAVLVKRYGAPPPVLGDEIRLGQVFVNLLVNAAQAIPEGRASENRITITTRCEPDAHGGRCVVEVADSGEGIAPDLLARIFEPFVTTKGGVGTGLGLSICHRIVTSFGGEITVDSEVGKGSVFRVILPALAADVTAEAAPRARGALAEGTGETPGARRRVLIVDDEEILARSLGDELAERHDVVVATGGRDAVRRLLDEPFDAVLCDVMMPDMSGLDVYDTVVAARPALAGRFVFMTGGVMSQAVWERLVQSKAERVEKPFRLDQIERLIASVRG